MAPVATTTYLIPLIQGFLSMIFLGFMKPHPSRESIVANASHADASPLFLLNKYIIRQFIYFYK